MKGYAGMIHRMKPQDRIADNPRNALRLDRVRLVKRFMDISICVSLAVPLLPIMFLIFLLIAIGSKGPPLYAQHRIGLNREVFTIFKFRSMNVTHKDNEVEQAYPGDTRITCIGRLLRSTGIDEFPQIFNVIIGDMSLVGPRPHPIKQDREFEEVISGYADRYRLRPGITGWAQVSGNRGAIHNLDKMRQRVELDNEYIDNWSLWLDLKILWMTVILLSKSIFLIFSTKSD